MSVIDKIDKLINEASMPSQSQLNKALSKGINGDTGIIFQLSMALWHYVNPKIIGSGGKIFKKGNNKKLVDELWDRLGSNLEKSEQFTDDFMKKLKSNFYGLEKTFNKIYPNFDSKGNYWETGGK